MSTLTEKTHDESTRVTDQLWFKILAYMLNINENYI